ncbi:hypothetical protein AX769_12440 [Frondihabitans sp. PAMC 28766]|uniref:NUDIX hydrolase n=1 Tax=Frondihabitans sp. PAMC 28766 TaxID=1795630 RepID=UPI00078DE94F|nr:NUDIX domain-containing protein [Frondihabitans sp. PAMC 28766]AMM20799.1 hypothetical protein AX769_12440 [Frondihabitans sp. PAMC 28766]
MKRIAGRVILLHDDSVLLMRGGDPARPEAGEWLFTIGGGCEPGETTAEAARREAFEEAGVRLSVDLGPVVLRREIEFPFNGDVLEQSEEYYLCRVTDTSIDSSGWTDLERASISGVAWWPLDELRATTLPVFPDGLVALVDAALAAG